MVTISYAKQSGSPNSFIKIWGLHRASNFAIISAFNARLLHRINICLGIFTRTVSASAQSISGPITNDVLPVPVVASIATFPLLHVL